MVAAMTRRTALQAMVFTTLLTAGLLPGMGHSARAASLPMPAPAASFQTESGTRSLAGYRGRKVMVWMFSTWCSSCAAAFEALSEKQSALNKAGLNIIALKNFENGGYPGPSLHEFVKRFGPTLLKEPNWTFGEVPALMAQAYNPRRYPDIYFLIDEKGILQAVQGAPGSTMATITRFAGLN